MADQTTTESIIMATLSTLSSSQLSSLSFSLSTTFRRHRHRLASLLSSPTLFTSTLNHLYSLSLSQKSLLIAHHLLSFLHLLTPFFPSLSPSLIASHRLRDLYSVLLLLFFCEVRQHNAQALQMSPAHWQRILIKYGSDTMLNISGLMSTQMEVLGAFVDIVVKYMSFINSKGWWCGGEAGRKVAASVAAVVALPSVEVENGGEVECVICKEEMREGSDVCEMPCHHLFHWKCVLPWLRKRNTCPCCRFRLPSDDVYGEIQRLWEAIVKASCHHFDGYQFTSKSDMSDAS